MSWYRVGTVSLTNNSPTVTGAGTDFVANARAGDAFIGPDGRPIEIASVVSATQLTLVGSYQGATAGGQGYSVQPTQAYERDLALGAATLLATFAAVRDGIGAGLISAAGTVAAPNLRFANDQDTGFRRVGENNVALVTGGADRLAVDGNGFTGFGTTAPATFLHAVRANADLEQRLDAYSTSFKTIVGNGFVSQGPRTIAPWVFVTADTERMRIDAAGNVGLGTAAPAANFDVGGGGSVSSPSARFFKNNGAGAIQGLQGVAFYHNLSQGLLDSALVWGASGNSYFTFGHHNGSSYTERARFDNAGALLVGVTSSTYGGHTFNRAVAENTAIAALYSSSTNARSLQVQAVGAEGFNGAASALYVGRSIAGRSVNAGGTMNASGADYAEYMRKAGGCGVLAKGQIVGVDADGKLTDRFSHAHSFVIKSTDPAYVGGDNWSPGPPPAEPTLALPPYQGPDEPNEPGAAPAELPILADRPVEPVRGAGEDDLAFIRRMAGWIVQDAAWVTAMDARPVEVEAQAMAETAHIAAEAKFKLDLVAWQKATAAHAAAVAAAEKKHADATAKYKADKAAWDTSMEAARQCVDRVAFSGQVPVNVAAGTFKPGDYIVGAKGRNDEIIGLVVTNAAMRLTPGLRCDGVGKVWRVMEDGRAWCAVLIG